MNLFLGPAGEVAPNARRPFDEGQMPPFDLAVEPPLRREPERELRDELRTWQPVSVYVGTVSAATEAGLAMPPLAGALVRGVRMVVRSAHASSTTNYWTMKVSWRDGASDYEMNSQSTQYDGLEAHVPLWLYHEGAGVRIAERNEVTVSFTATGSPDALSGVMLYADLYVGV